MGLSPIRTLDPSVAHTHAPARAFARALRLFHEAAERVPAYTDFLKRAGVRPESIQSKADFQNIPVTDKPNYFSRYSLKELSWDGSLASAKYISTSSGSTGVPFFWPRGEAQDVMTGLMKQNIYQGLFEASTGSTLFVNSFSLGTWIAGLEFFNAARWVAEHGACITIVSPGIDKAEAVNQIKKLAPLFSRIVIAGYPPFVKDIIEYGSDSGIEWKKMDLRLLFGGEAVSEIWKDRLLEHIGRTGEFRRIVNIYGMAESGVVAHDTPVSTYLRRSLQALGGASAGLPDPDRTMGLYQYYPLARYFEVVSGDSLLLTANAGLPLIRYSTRDNGGLLAHQAVAKLGPKFASTAKRQGADIRKWQLPFVYLYGRKDLSISLYAVNIYVENIKSALEHSVHTRKLSGLFIMGVTDGKRLDQQFQVTIELARDAVPDPALAKTLATEIIAGLCGQNSEYAKLYSVIGIKARPRVNLVRYGDIQTVPGRKHKWTKRN